MDYKNDSEIAEFEKILEKIESKVEYADIRSVTGKNTSILMKDGKLQNINTGFTSGARIRVLKNGSWGFAFTNDIAKLNEIYENAIKLSGSLSGDVELAEVDIVNDEIKSNAKIPLSSVSIEEKEAIIKEANASANIGEVKSTTVSYVDSESKNIFLSTEGTSIITNPNRVAMFLNSVASSGDIIQIGHGSLGGASGFEALSNEDIEEFGRNIGEKATRLLKASTPPAGQFEVITDPELTGVFIHEALGHAVESDLILKNDSILKGKMGEKIGSKLVNIYDDPSLNAFGHYDYDVEGVKTSPNLLVKDGELVSLLSSRESASKLNIEPSGNARSTVSDQPIVRMSNTYLNPGDMNFEELIEDIKDGIYLKGSRGGQVDTGKGIFQFNASESFKIKNGEITDPLRDVSLSGNILETLQMVESIGSDFKLSVGFCGKDGQTVPVGDGGSHIKLSKATVGGAL